MGARFACVGFGGLQIEVVSQLPGGIVVLPAHLERARQVVIGVAPPGGNFQGFAQQRNGLVESGRSAGLLDLVSCEGEKLTRCLGDVRRFREID